MTVIGMDLGGTKLATAVFDEAGNVRHHDRVALDGRRGVDVAALVAERCATARAQARAQGLSEVDGVGVTVPGIYRAARGTVWAPNIPGWDDYPLRDELRAALGDDLPVVIDSDRAACIVGETWRGAAQGARDAVFIAVGTGIGAGLLVDGRVVRGAGDIAGAVGWLALDRPFRDAYVSCGCFEHHASGPGLAKVARELIAADETYRGELRDVAADVLSAHHVFAAHERGDPVAVRVIGDAIAFWGMAAANFVSLLNPEVVVFGGGVFGPAARFLERIRAESVRWAQPIAMGETRFVASTLGGDAGLYGAGRLALLAKSTTVSAT